MKEYTLLPPFGWRRLKPLWPTVVVMSVDDFDALERSLTEPAQPTKSILRGAEMIRQIYGPSRKRPSP